MSSFAIPPGSRTPHRRKSRMVPFLSSSFGHGQLGNSNNNNQSDATNGAAGTGSNFHQLLNSIKPTVKDLYPSITRNPDLDQSIFRPSRRGLDDGDFGLGGGGGIAGGGRWQSSRQGGGGNENNFLQQIQQLQEQQEQEQYQSQEATEPIVLADIVQEPVDQLCEAVDQLAAKMRRVADIHMGLAQFNESFGAFLYGLQATAQSVEWTEAPTKKSFERQAQRHLESTRAREQEEEELSRLRQAQLELEQENERIRQEAAEQRAIELHEQQMQANRDAATASAASSHHQRALQTNNNASNYQRRATAIPVRSGAGGAPARGRPVGAENGRGGASRVGPGGQIRKLSGKLVMKRMAERLPLKYRDEPHRGPIEAIMLSLGDHLEGQALPELVQVSGVARHRCNEYLGVLVHAKEVVKSSGRGVVFSLNPDRYPSR